MGISTHVLDTSLGRPAAGVAVTLEERRGSEWLAVGSGETDGEGRIRSLAPDGRALEPGTHRLRFAVEDYFAGQGRTGFFPSVEIVFRVGNAGEHYHVPLLLSPYGYSTYRGT